MSICGISCLFTFLLPLKDIFLFHNLFCYFGGPIFFAPGTAQSNSLLDAVDVDVDVDVEESLGLAVSVIVKWSNNGGCRPCRTSNCTDGLISTQNWTAKCQHICDPMVSRFNSKKKRD